MAVSLRGLRGIFRRGEAELAVVDPAVPVIPPLPDPPAFEIRPDDPIIFWFQRASGAVDIDALNLDSPALHAMRHAGVKLVVPLISQGELIGLLNLGQRMSEQEYSSDDRRLLDNLAAHAAPAVRVAQLVRQQQLEAQERESIAQELRIAHLIQQTLLPKRLPDLNGWEIGAYYQPARAVGGDFYDFIDLQDGLVGVVVGDASSKGVPAALVMATTRTMLRASAQRLVDPGEVLARTNDVLSTDIPRNMFVTCFYAVLNPETGYVRFANAGHCLPVARTRDGAKELRATGWPLGLMPGVSYEVKEATLEPGDSFLLYSDGLAEAHDNAGEMFGIPRISTIVSDEPDASRLIDDLLTRLRAFTGPDHEQEDDITLVTFERSASARLGAETFALHLPIIAGGNGSEEPQPNAQQELQVQVLDEFQLPSVSGNERTAMDRVADLAGTLGMPDWKLQRLKTAVAEATMNAIEHGNRNQSELPVVFRIVADAERLSVSIIDQGGDKPIPTTTTPDLEAKLAGLQSPRGWGLFLIRNMVDDMHVWTDEDHHTVELIFNLAGDEDRPEAESTSNTRDEDARQAAAGTPEGATDDGHRT